MLCNAVLPTHMRMDKHMVVARRASARHNGAPPPRRLHRIILYIVRVFAGAVRWHVFRSRPHNTVTSLHSWRHYFTVLCVRDGGGGGGLAVYHNNFSGMSRRERPAAAQSTNARTQGKYKILKKHIVLCISRDKFSRVSDAISFPSAKLKLTHSESVRQTKNILFIRALFFNRCQLNYTPHFHIGRIEKRFSESEKRIKSL